MLTARRAGRSPRRSTSWPRPKYDCAPATLPGLFGDPYAWEVTQLADRVTFAYEKDDIVRTVWLGGHGHPEPGVGGVLHPRTFDGSLRGRPAGRRDDAVHVRPGGHRRRLPERARRRRRSVWSSATGARATACGWRLTVEDPIFLLRPHHLRHGVAPERPAPCRCRGACDPEAAQRNLRLIPHEVSTGPARRAPEPVREVRVHLADRPGRARRAPEPLRRRSPMSHRAPGRRRPSPASCSACASPPPPTTAPRACSTSPGRSR